MLLQPRCKYCGPDAVNSWYHDMAAYIKSIDPNHMVTTGEEGGCLSAFTVCVGIRVSLLAEQ